MPAPTPSATFLSENAKVQGDLVVPHDATIAGEITGNLRVHGRVTLEATAVVGGDLSAATAYVSGQVEGQIHADRRVALMRGARVAGGIVTAQLEVAQGVVYQGPLRLTGDAEISTPQSTPEPAERPVAQATIGACQPIDALPAVPGATHAGLRRRRRTPLSSVS